MISAMIPMNTKSSKCLTLTKRLGLILVMVAAVSSAAAQSPRITQSGEVVALQNENVRFEFDLARGSYGIFRQNDRHPTLSNARLRINEWSSDATGVERTWTQRAVNDSSGKGLALDLRFKSGTAPELWFSFVLHEGQDFINASAGIFNSGTQPIRIKSIHVLADGVVYEGVDKTKDFAMVDGFSGGEPLEYGRRFYSPLTRANALHSRNNILLTFSDDNQRRTLVMGGLTYQDFEKFATIAQKRRTELELGTDRKPSLLCYLDLPREKSDRSAGGEILELTKGKNLRTWENHQFRCVETATSVMEPGNIILTASNLKQDRPYTVGFSWWHGLRHGTHPDLVQSVFVEFEKDGVPQRLPLLENRTLPRFDGVKKQDVEQVELPLPSAAIQSGNLRIVVEKAGGTDPAETADENVYLSEIWLRDGRLEALMPATPAAVADGPRPRREFTAQLFAADPVGKRVDPGQRYQMPDRFYMDITGSDPFVALENYAQRVKSAQGVGLSLYDFPTVCMWYAADKRYGGSEAENTSLGAVEEMQRIAASGFLKYSRASVRLVPDSYMPNNQQGWWDDKHWQREDTDRHVSQNGRYVKPFETTEKWGKAVTALGGIPLTYIQTGYRSEDYAKAFPGHMLFNKQYAWKGQPVDTEGEIFTTWEKTWTRNGSVVWGYDYTDPDFLAHMGGVYANLKAGGIKGLMFDYPESGRAKAGGMEDDSSTMAAAYRRIFQLAHDGLGSDSYLDERNMEFGSDVTLGVVDSMRTENDTDDFDGTTVTRCGLRWYKNRVLVSHDTDSKNLARLQGNRDHVRAVLTMAYVVTGRLLLANSFVQLSPETFHDLTRTFPYHTSAKSARPVDAFVSDSPAVYDFEVNPGWHQVTFFNADKSSPRAVGIDLSGPQVNGALGLNADREYYCFDFWNHRFIGKQKGDTRLAQQLRPGEARMISVRECLQRPQVLSTDRHVMQGYLDLQREQWDGSQRVLTGVSKIVGGDPYTVTLALNGHSLGKLECANPQVATRLSPPSNGIVEFSLTGPENATVEWTVSFGPG
jgi:hypothetical protein